MSIFQMSGTITVKVSPEDIKAICLKKPHAIHGFPPALQALAAALDLPDVRSFNEQCNKHHYCLSNHRVDVHDNGDFEVVFSIIKRNIFKVISNGE